MPPRVSVPSDFGYRPFALADARAIGIPARVVRGSRFRRIFRGIYIRVDVLDTPVLRFDATRRLASSDVWATCHTAACYDVPVPATTQTHIGLPPDLSYPAQRTAIEYDGADHTKPRQRHRDNRRRESYDREGWKLLVVTSIDVFTFPAQALVRVWTALRERAHAQTPSDLADDWRQYFDPRRRREATS